jgi:hypothetical protein
MFLRIESVPAGAFNRKSILQNGRTFLQTPTRAYKNSPVVPIYFEAYASRQCTPNTVVKA